jgi:hypothetical protein
MDAKLIAKIVAGIAMIFGVAYGFLDLLFQPHYLLIDGAKSLPKWSRWLGWIISSLGVFAYLTIDLYDRFKR